MLKRVLVGLLTVLLAGVWVFSGHAPDAVYKVFPGYFPDPDRLWDDTPLTPMEATEKRLSDDVITARAERQNNARQLMAVESDKQILFGDTHVHSTNSADAFMYSLPMMHGTSGAYPPAYACDYARFISQLDFYFLTDHAESFTPSQWQDSIDSVQQCNRLAGDPENPDLAAFIGWEWTQVGATAEKHYGHHNVLFKDDQTELLPARPIASVGLGVATIAARSNSSKQSRILGLIDPRHRGYYSAYNEWVGQMAAIPACDDTLPSPSLPSDCFETAATPGALYNKLDQWGFDTMVIPHGTSWGYYTPPNANWTHQLNSADNDPEKTGLIEVYSGHGNSEVFRNFAVRNRNADGEWVCPEPQANYLPSCWQAGEIIRKRCLAENADASECERRAIEARHNFVQVDTIHGFMTVPGSTAKEWLDAGQARDIFLPALNYRPRKSVQYGLALQNFDNAEEPQRFRWGFLASTDTHSARPGHGFKQYGRIQTTDSTGVRSPYWAEVFKSGAVLAPKSAHSLAADQIDPVSAKLFASEFERATSFLNTGGLAAVHSEGRSRDAIWSAMKRREVYGTSGHRMMLWFDLLNAEETQLEAGETSQLKTDEASSESITPMGSAVEMTVNPRFRVKAMGSFKQLPGCPDYVVSALEERRFEKMAQGECYHPSDERYQIERIEVIRIRPQMVAGEPVEPLIEDNWRVFECSPSAQGCTVEFEDPAFSTEGRNALYYVRALEEPIATINGANLRADFDENGDAVSTAPCYGDFRTEITDECQEPSNQRAWSSPIFVDYKNNQQ